MYTILAKRKPKWFTFQIPTQTKTTQFAENYYDCAQRNEEEIPPMAQLILGLEVRQKEVNFELGETQVTEGPAIELCKQYIFLGLFLRRDEEQDSIALLAWNSLAFLWTLGIPTSWNALGMVFLIRMDGIRRLERERQVDRRIRKGKCFLFDSYKRPNYVQFL